MITFLRHKIRNINGEKINTNKRLNFFRQEIISYPNDREVREYELLLRTNNEGCHVFPEELL